MNSNWRNRPTNMEIVPNGIDYYIAIDESGSSNLKQVKKSKDNGKEPCGSEVNFTVTACEIKMSDYDNTRDMIMNLKLNYWKNAIYNYNGVEKQVCFHSREIRLKEKAFSTNLIDYSSFIKDLSSLMKEVPIKLYVSNINKWKHINQYYYPASPYDLCMTFVLERIVSDMSPKETCVIVLESRGTNEDKKLLNFIKQIIDNGTNYHSANDFKKIKGVYFNPKWCKNDGVKESNWELEIADLCAYPFYKYFTYGKEDESYKLLLQKLSNYPAYQGKGLKSFP